MTQVKSKSVFETLAAINVYDYIDKRGGLSYVSWANAWMLLKREFPTATRTIYEHDHTGMNYFSDGRTCYVKVGVTINKQEIIDMLPVMDFRNKSISVDSVTSMDVNKAIQRVRISRSRHRYLLSWRPCLLSLRLGVRWRSSSSPLAMKSLTHLFSVCLPSINLLPPPSRNCRVYMTSPTKRSKHERCNRTAKG